jgi:chromosome partitioning protein
VECAYQAGNQQHTVLVIDLDPQANATEMMLGEVPAEGTIFDLFLGTKTLNDVLKPALDAWPNTLLVPGSPRMSTVFAHLGGKSGQDRILRKLLQPVRDYFGVILIDLGPAIDQLTINAMVAADVFHIPADLSNYTLSGIQSILRVADDVIDSDANADLKFGGVHLAGFHKGGAHAIRDLKSSIEDTTRSRVIAHVPHSVKVVQSQRDHKPVGLIDPQGNVALAYATLTSHLLGSIQ